MKRYETYKDSGVQWLGEIPNHWEIDKISQHFTERREKVSDKDFPPLSVSKEGITPQLETAVKTDNGDNRKKVCKGDFVVNSRSDRKGSCGFSPYDGSVSLINIVLNPRDINGRYYHYMFRSHNYIEEFYRLGRGIVADLWTTRYTEMRNIMIPVPSLKEQEIIVAFLDEKTAKIDELVAQVEREIELLKEYKQTEIARVVTKGLNPNAPMKPSGIFWQPFVPNNWRVTRLKNVIIKLNRQREPGSELLVCSNSGDVKKRGDSKLGLVAENENIYQGVKQGDLLIHGMDTWHGAIAVSEYFGMCTPVVHVCDSSQNKDFIALYLRNMATQKIFKLISNGVRQNTSDFRSWDKLASIPIVLPSIQEQNDICSHIKQLVSRIKPLVENLLSQIEHLKEYKQRLIADVVTGKINVQNN